MNIRNYITIIFINLMAFSFAKAKEVTTYLLIKESTQTLSKPDGLKPFSKTQLNDFLKTWKGVEKKNFYYESTEGVTFPFQEGVLTFEDGTTANWRYYHCGGLRIKLLGKKSRYLLPETKMQNKSCYTTSYPREVL